MKVLAALAAALLPALALAQPKAVDVRFGDLDKFTDFRLTDSGAERERPDLADDLRRLLERRGPQFIPAGSHLDVTIRDVDMAGELEPNMRSPHMMTRIVRGVYIPRIDLDFKLVGADGRVLKEGRRELRDPSFLNGPRVSSYRNESLAYEKAMLDRWLAREFPAERRAAR